MIDETRLKRLKELLKDAESCARLTQWEEEFLDGFRTRVASYGEGLRISDAQEMTLQKIEAKVYA